MQVAKWGNSLAVRLPARLVRELGLKEGDKIDLQPDTGGISITRRRRPEEVLADLDRFRGRLPPGQRLSRAEAHER
ncbi:AbrB/MazE/SpoVT family DNA-binding domain-containing protein [Roseobacter litoralis]|uniref:AbrB/MazE/SpoVT family DNA-binding domain-containing protein n=1 Tax=Roseobacter litoralis TaxID=42443 RepID=UPI002494E023|nr:AbrB/MazE/SpoVT family DNA-binding domain-containing protein [Roseobacter litoralis]